MTNLDLFIDRLSTAVALKKFSGTVSADEVNKVKEDLKLREKVLEAIFNAVMEKLPKEKAELFEKVVEEGDESKIQEYFAADIEKIEDLENIVLSAVQKLEN